MYFGIFFNQINLRGKGPCAFADGFAYGPEPAGVDVRMSDSVCGHDRAGGTEIKKLFENSACGSEVCGILVPDVGGAPEDSEETADAPVSFGQSLEKREENLEIKLEVPRFTVEDCEIARAEQAGERMPRMFGFAEETERVDESEEIVCRAFDPEFQLFPCGMRSFEKIAVLGISIREGAGVGQSVDGCAFRVEDQSFPAEIRQKGDLPASKVFRHRSCDVEPGALPVLSPFLSPVQRLVGEGEAIRKFHRILTARVFTLQIDLLGIDFLFDPVAKHVRTAPVKFDFFWKHAENPLVQN